MKILIVEDETAAYENLADMILSLDSSIEIMGNTESVRQTGSLAASQSETGFAIYGYSFVGWFRFRDL